MLVNGFKLLPIVDSSFVGDYSCVFLSHEFECMWMDSSFLFVHNYHTLLVVGEIQNPMRVIVH